MEVKKEVLCLNLSAKTLCKKDIHKTKEFDCYKTKKGGGSSNFNIFDADETRQYKSSAKNGINCLKTLPD